MSAIALFISYSHDSDEHRDRVLGLSERLRADGIPTILDRYVEKGSPSEGWPRWMMNGLNAATHVLCVCTEIYRRRFLGQEVPDAGSWRRDRAMLQAVSERAARTFKWIADKLSLLDKALNHLTLGRAALYAAILEGSSLDPCRALLKDAVTGLRRAGTQHELPRGLLPRAWLRFLEGASHRP